MSEQRFTRRDVDEILARATAADDVTDEGLTLEQLQRVADEVGISESALAAATAAHLRSRAQEAAPSTWADRVFGARCVSRSKVIPTPPPVAAARADRQLRRRRLVQEGDQWVPRNGSWPDPVSSVTVAPIVTHITPYRHGDGSRVRLDCDLSEVRTGYLTVAALALFLIPMMMVAVGVPFLGEAAGMLAAGTAGWAARAAYEQRASHVASQLGALLDALHDDGAGTPRQPNWAPTAGHR